jgi:hypothetical protein
VCATIDLLAGDDDHAVIVIRQRQALDLARAERIDPLADDQWRRVLPQIDGAYHRRGQRQRFHRARAGGTAPDRADELREVLGRRAAAATHDPDSKLVDHLAQITSHLIRPERIDR